MSNEEIFQRVEHLLQRELQPEERQFLIRTSKLLGCVEQLVQRSEKVKAQVA